MYVRGRIIEIKDENYVVIQSDPFYYKYKVNIEDLLDLPEIILGNVVECDFEDAQEL